MMLSEQIFRHTLFKTVAELSFRDVVVYPNTVDMYSPKKGPKSF